VVDHKLYGSRAEFDGTIDRVLEDFRTELVCLAGFMRILTGPFVKKWSGAPNSHLYLHLGAFDRIFRPEKDLTITYICPKRVKQHNISLTVQ